MPQPRQVLDPSYKVSVTLRVDAGSALPGTLRYCAALLRYRNEGRHVNQSTLKRYTALYRNASYFGSADTLRRYLGMPADYILPLALPHGVDFGQVKPCMDLAANEPIHWAHNESIYSLSHKLKPTVRLPHAFLLAMEESCTGAMPRRGCLVVGPPSGPENDARLHDLLKKNSLRDVTIMVKAKKGSHISRQFWESHGYSTISLGVDAESNYEGLVNLLSPFERVIGCTLSSAILFASALGCHSEILDNYRYRAYEVANKSALLEYDGSARDFVRSFIRGNTQKATAAARTLLGEDFFRDREVMQTDIRNAIDRLTEPLFVSVPYVRPVRWLLSHLARATGRVGVLHQRPTDLLRRVWHHQVTIMEIDEKSFWLDGRTATNPSFTTVPYVRGITVPGDAVVQY